MASSTTIPSIRIKANSETIFRLPPPTGIIHSAPKNATAIPIQTHIANSGRKNSISTRNTNRNIHIRTLFQIGVGSRPYVVSTPGFGGRGIRNFSHQNHIINNNQARNGYVSSSRDPSRRQRSSSSSRNFVNDSSNAFLLRSYDYSGSSSSGGFSPQDYLNNPMFESLNSQRRRYWGGGGSGGFGGGGLGGGYGGKTITLRPSSLGGLTKKTVHKKLGLINKDSCKVL